MQINQLCRSFLFSHDESLFVGFFRFRCKAGRDGDMFACRTIKKSQFQEMKNDALDLEPLVECIECGRKQHQICVLYMESIWPQGFVCEGCRKKKNMKRKENKFTSKRLPTTRLSNYLETRVNNFLKKKEAGAGEVYIRVVSSTDKNVEVKAGMKARLVPYLWFFFLYKGCLFVFNVSRIGLESEGRSCWGVLDPSA